MAAPSPARNPLGAASLASPGDILGSTSLLTVSDEVAAGLGGLGRLAAADATGIVERVWAVLTSRADEGSGRTPADVLRAKRGGGGEEGAEAAERAHAAASSLCTVLLEGARLGCGEDAIRSLLLQYDVSPELSALVCAKYAPSLRALREIHCSAGTPIPSLVDVDWRLDYVVKSSKSGPVNQALYVVKLTTAAPGSPVLRHVQFTCSPPQLQDLLAKVSDATRAAAAALKDL